MCRFIDGSYKVKILFMQIGGIDTIKFHFWFDLVIFEL